MFSNSRYTITLFFMFFCLIASCQDINSLYDDSYLEIKSMLKNEKEIDFKKVVYLVENSYFENQVDESTFNKIISTYASFCQSIISSGRIIYSEKDKETASAQCAVFMFMTDTIPVNLDDEIVLSHPF